MKILSAIWRFLTEKKDHNVTDTSVINTSDIPVTARISDPAPSSVAQVAGVDVNNDDVFEKLKSLLVLAGHDIEKEWDLAVAYAKALAEK